MGVPKFFRYISERYPCLSEVVKEYQIPDFDNLYLDMNGIIHMCSHPNDFDPHFRITEEQIFKDIFHYIEILFRMIQPKRLFFMAIDGVAPRAKMNQQRGRRFRSAKEAEILENKAREKGESLPSAERFDSNCITPGTDFMVNLQAQLKYFVTYKVSTDKTWQKVKVILSGHETPGEGEHKIMDYIRYMKSQPGYDCNIRHCLYGLDADLIMLGLCTHEPHFSLLREEVKFGKKQKRITTPEETTFFLLHLSLMREYIDLEFQQLKTTVPFPYDLENIIDDWVLMGFLVGNDFIPHLPDLHIDKGALQKLYQVYMQVLPTLGGYINEGGTLRLERFQKYLEKLADFDLEQFKDTYADIKFFESKTGRKPFREAEEPVKDPDLAKLIESSALALEGSDDDSDNYEDVDSDDESTFIEEFAQHKNNYYVNKLEYEKVTPEVLRSQAEGYVRAIQWNLNYYYNGCCSWSWFYPHHYAPYISDIKDFSDLVLHYDLGTPFLPFQQLLAVLPSASKNLLPKPLQELMVDSDSPLIDFYPTEFKTDMNGKRQEWEAVVLIPFINQDKLLAAMDLKLDRLSEEERARNAHGPMHIYTYTKESLGSYIAPAYFPSLENHHAKEVKVLREEIHVEKDRLVKGLCPGINLDVYVPGFPTLRHIAFSACLSRAKVKVFEQPSRGDNMILKVTPQGHPDVSEVANQLVGKIIYVNWPHLSEAKVVAVANKEKRYTLNQDKSESRLCIEEASSSVSAQFELSKEGIESRYSNRMGVDIGRTEILVYCCTMEGKMIVFSENGKVALEKQWSKLPAPYALQTTVRDIGVYDPVCVQQKSVEEVFPVNSICFVLVPPHYGCTGVVKDSTKNDSIKLNVTIAEEPDLTAVQKSLHHLRTRYMYGNVIAQRLGISPFLLARITGNIFVVTDSGHNLNIGLNLKFSKRNQEVCGFTRRDSGQWMYSSKALDLVRDYMSTFPDLFEYFEQNTNNDSMQIKEIFPENTAEKLATLTAWLKEQPGAKAEKQTCGAEVLEEVIVEAIEKVVDDCFKSDLGSKTLPLEIKPSQIYQPKVTLGKLSPDSSAQHSLFDRIVNVRDCYTVPLGFRGTIIGIHVAESEMDVMYDIVFDKEFAGGLKLRCTTNRGYRMSGQGFLNLSHGKRVEASKTQKPTAVVTPTGPSRGHNSAFASWRQKPEPTLKVDVAPFMRALEAISVQKQEDEVQRQLKSRTAKPSQPVEARNEFQAMWTELQKAGQSQPKIDKNKSKAEAAPEVLQPDPSSVMLKKMLKIADDCTPKVKKKPEEKSSDPSYCMQLMTYFQKQGLGLPTYQYIKAKEGLTAQVFCNNRFFVGTPATDQDKAAENVAKVALDFIKNGESLDKTGFGLKYQAPSSRPPLLTNPQQVLPARLLLSGRGGRNGNWNAVPTPPTPPQQWYQRHSLYHHVPSDNMPMNWQQRMPSVGNRVPNYVNISRAGHAPPFQPPVHHPQLHAPSSNWRQVSANPFVPLQADKKMRQYRGETERIKETTPKESASASLPTEKKENSRSSTSLSNSSETSMRKPRIAAKFPVPWDDEAL